MQVVQSSVLMVASALLAFGCASADSSEGARPRIRSERSASADPAAAPGASHAARPSSPSAVAPSPTRGEQARFEVDGDTVRVNNTLCASSRSAMDPSTLGQFVSRVQYAGNDPRFQGRTFEFNQCCGGCIARFPQQWAQNADAILAFHGVDPPALAR